MRGKIVIVELSVYFQSLCIRRWVVETLDLMNLREWKIGTVIL